MRTGETVAPTAEAGSNSATLIDSPTPAPAKDSTSPILVPTPTIAEPVADAVTWNPDENQLRLTLVTSGLDSPLFVTHAGDDSGRLFVVEKPGRIKIMQEGLLLETPFLELTDRVNAQSYEQGLLGLAFAPDYADSGTFYINYTDRNGDTVISRLQRSDESANRADPTSESTILKIEQPASNHNGGMIAFAPDGYLIIGTGDGGAANDRFGNGQNPSTLLGKLLRIDVSNPDATPYAIPEDNPWADQSSPAAGGRAEIWALGLRNPWRFSFDRLTDDLWIGDVGQNQFEEVNQIPYGAASPVNYGWPIMEGTSCFRSANCDSAGLHLPVTDYSHADGCSVTGGYVYRGQASPLLDGVYFFGDFCSGKIWTTWPVDGGWRTTLVLDTALTISSFGEDEQGELYVTDLQAGTVHQLGLTTD